MKENVDLFGRITLYFAWLIISLMFIIAVYLNPNANIFVWLQVGLIILLAPCLLVADMIHTEQIRRVIQCMKIQ